MTGAEALVTVVEALVPVVEALVPVEEVLEVLVPVIAALEGVEAVGAETLVLSSWVVALGGEPVRNPLQDELL